MVDVPKVAKAKVTKGTGPDQLPQGAATDINNAPEGTPPEDATAGTQPAALAEEQLPLPAERGANVPVYQPDTEDEAWLTGPTLRPDESQIVGTQPRVPLSAAVRRALPLLKRAASSPDADPQLVALVSYLSREAGKG